MNKDYAHSMQDDTISRQAAIDRATKEHDFYKGATIPTDKARRDELLNVMCWLGELPSAQPTIDAVEVVHGEWEVVDQEEPRRYGCSVCKRLSFYATNYCSYCGARMDGEVKSDEMV